MTETLDTPTLIWHGCYDGSWKGVITDESFAHPAKFAPKLIERILRHGLERGYWKLGETVGDPFGGVACGGIVAGMLGLNWRGVELEPRFVAMGRKNIEANRRFFGGCSVELMQGDSRRFAEIVRVGSEQGDNYGTTPGNIGNLREGKMDAAVTSPPWEDGAVGGCPASKLKQPPTSGKGHAASLEARQRQAVRDEARVYGDSEGQVGKESGETYWSAMRIVYAECYKAIKPGGFLCVIVKDYVKDKARVPLCDQTLQLLQAVGFEPVERIHAMLTKTVTHNGLFGVEKRTTERKSFFRRLAEKKGSPRIDWEEVLIVRRLP